MSKITITLKGSGAVREIAPKLAELLISKGKAEFKEVVETKKKAKAKK